MNFINQPILRHLAEVGIFGLVQVWAWQAWGAGTTPHAPDLFGPWARNAFNFEPLASGPMPLVNLKRLPDGTGDPGQLVGDYKNPILRPEAAEVVKKSGEISLSGTAYLDPSNRCGPYAPPFTFAMQLGMEILQKTDGITIIYNQDDQVRHVRLNSRHPQYLQPSAMGDSVGRYEGTDLIIDTVGIKIDPFGMVDRYGTPHSEALHVTERYHLIDGATAKEAQERHEKSDGRVGGVPGAMPIDPDITLEGLQVRVTVDDPKVFTTQWSADITYRRGRGAWVEQVCAENPIDYPSGKVSPVPIATEPDF